MPRGAVIRSADERSPILRMVDLSDRPRKPDDDSDPQAWPGDLVTRQVRARRGEVVVYRGARGSGLHIIRSGSCKSVLAAPNGLEHVAGYHIVGDVLGVQTVLGEPHDATIVALEDSEICVVSSESAQYVADRSDDFRHDLWRLMVLEIARQRQSSVMLSVLRAEQRLAWFILDLADRYRARGYSSCEFTLRMTRQDIGSCLGLTQETVSRLFRRFHRDGLVHIEGRAVKVIDRVALGDVLDDTTSERDAVPK